jgi:hypothetical protein
VIAWTPNTFREVLHPTSGVTEIQSVRRWSNGTLQSIVFMRTFLLVRTPSTGGGGILWTSLEASNQFDVDYMAEPDLHKSYLSRNV